MTLDNRAEIVIGLVIDEAFNPFFTGVISSAFSFIKLSLSSVSQIRITGIKIHVLRGIAGTHYVLAIDSLQKQRVTAVAIRDVKSTYTL